MINTSQLARIGIVVFLIVGCLFVLRPFLAAILFATIICVFTWPWYQKLWSRLGERDTWAALAMTLLLLVALLLPVAYLAANLAESVARVASNVPELERSAFLPPDWLQSIPLVGAALHEAWGYAVSSDAGLLQVLKQAYEPARAFGVRVARFLGVGFLQLLMVVFVAFFFYRDGARLAYAAVAASRKLGGKLGEEMLDLTCKTINGVMLGIFGTALTQSVVAFIGFSIAGIPASLLLASAVFFLSVIPVGPPIAWGIASLWLYNQGDYGWAIFMALYGMFVISGVDNVIKPILISHSASLPMLLIVLGVLGGVLAFGFIGIFLGPIFLAVGMTLLAHWINRKNTKVVKLND